MRRAVLVVLAACGDNAMHAPDAPPPAADAPMIDARVDAPAPDADLFDLRPYEVRVPTGYSPETPAPLVVLLHGYGVPVAMQEQYFRLTPVLDAAGALYALPQGTGDNTGNPFWAATDACCGEGVDDVAYLTALLDDVASRYTVDPKRIFLVGHSNGGFMAHRMACDRADRIAAIVSLAGATWADPTRCAPTEPVAVAEVHGTLDTVIEYDGGENGFGVAYPSAPTTRDTWSALNGCTSAQAGPAYDLVGNLPGSETTTETRGGCGGNSAAELWTITDGIHVPNLRASTWGATVWAFLQAHPKP